MTALSTRDALAKAIGEVPPCDHRLYGPCRECEADALLASGLLDSVRAEALREAAVPVAYELSRRLLDVGHPPETTGTAAALAQRALRSRADDIEAAS